MMEKIEKNYILVEINILNFLSIINESLESFFEYNNLSLHTKYKLYNTLHPISFTVIIYKFVYIYLEFGNIF